MEPVNTIKKKVMLHRFLQCSTNIWFSSGKASHDVKHTLAQAKQEKPAYSDAPPNFQAFLDMFGSFEYYKSFWQKQPKGKDTRGTKLNPLLQGPGPWYGWSWWNSLENLQDPSIRESKSYQTAISKGIRDVTHESQTFTSLMVQPSRIAWVLTRLCGSWWSLKRRTCPDGPKAHRPWRSAGLSWGIASQQR